jgi:hypothetical protein
MQGCRRYSRSLVAAVAIGGALACAEGVGPNGSPDVVGQPGGSVTGDSVWSSESDMTVPSNRLRGMVVAVSPDSTTAWRPVASVRVEAARRDAHTTTMTVLATTTSDSNGRFIFDRLDVPAGLLFVRTVPPAGTPYRASRWLAAYAFVGPWINVGSPTDSRWLGPYLALERSGAPQREHAPVLVLGHVRGDVGQTAVARARVVIDRMVPPSPQDSALHKPPTSIGTVASGRTDANGFFLIELPGPGLYASRFEMPAESPFTRVPLGGAFVASANAETSVVNYLGVEVGRR